MKTHNKINALTLALLASGILASAPSQAQVITFNRAAARAQDFWRRPPALSLRADLMDSNNGLDAKANYNLSSNGLMVGLGIGSNLSKNLKANTHFVQFGGSYVIATGYHLNAELRVEGQWSHVPASIPFTSSTEEGLFFVTPYANAFVTFKQSSNEKTRAVEYVIEVNPLTSLVFNLRYNDLLHSPDAAFIGLGAYPYTFSDGTRVVVEADLQLNPEPKAGSMWQRVRLGASAYFKKGYKAFVSVLKPGQPDQRIELRADIPF